MKTQNYVDYPSTSFPAKPENSNSPAAFIDEQANITDEARDSEWKHKAFVEEEEEEEVEDEGSEEDEDDDESGDEPEEE